MYYSKYPNVIKLPTPLSDVKINDLMKDLIPFYSIWMFVLYILSIAIMSLFANYKVKKNNLKQKIHFEIFKIILLYFQF